jgi:hypothetical protein
MPETKIQEKVNLLGDEIESWRPFIDALRAEDRDILRDLIEKCGRFVDAIESSKKRYLVEPLFLTILLVQEEQIRWLESELEALRKESSGWKSKDGF